MADHGRAGSWLSPMGYQRECTCGETFTGTAEASFEARENHIADGNAVQVVLFSGEVYTDQGLQLELGD